MGLLHMRTGRILQSFLLASAFTVAGGVSLADSSLPPSSPDNPIQAGTLDRVRSMPSGGQVRFPCVGYDVVLNFNNRYFNTQYIRFGIDIPESVVEFRMRETPDATLWFDLRRSDLSLIQTYKGGDDQKFSRTDLTAATNYFVQVVTDGSMARRPDGTNHAFVVFRGLPRGIAERLERPANTNPINLGYLSAGSPIKRSDAVFEYRKRQLDFTPSRTDRTCPDATGSDVGFSELKRDYTLQAPAGEIFVDLTVLASQNWTNQTRFDVQRWVGYPQQWGPVQGLPFRHGGGELKLRAGRISDSPIIMMPDAYVEYALTVSMRPIATTDPTTPGSVIPPTDLSAPFQNPRIIIGPTR